MAFSELLNEPFTELTKAQFLSFLQNQFLKGFFTPVFDKDNVVANYVSNLQFIKQINILGSADDLEDLIVLEIIKQNKGDSRVGLTSEIFKLISNNDFLNKPRFNVLAIVRSEKEPEQWRLSLITSEGKTRSNPRRFSFLLGVNEKVRTPKQQLIDGGGVKSWDDLKERFNVEVVKEQFFNLYINLFLEVYDAIITNDVFNGIIKKKEVEPISFAKNLMGKIVFLHFIQKKGWLGITDKNGKFGEGDHKFFKKNLDKLTTDGDLFNKKINFYNDFLEPLFYDGLNKEQKNCNDWNEKLQMKIPYLNGGLFQEEYDWEHTTINLNNDIFKAIIEAFDVYNFTIDEGDIYDREIAVDPEMLGRLFEKMIGFNTDNQEVIDRILKEYKEIKKKRKINMPSPEHIIDLDLGKDKNKKLGAFYTPREIVQYMTRKSIKEYLVSKLGESYRSTIEQLFTYRDEYLSKQEIESKVNEIDNQLNSLETKVTYTSLKHDVFDIIELLNDIKVLDPAVGSGAFPMGILQELVSLKEYLINVFGLEKKTTYEIKREIIQNNIFGVDIDPGAVDIARLRFWLGLVVDEDKPEPLPNLDFKFICANSLIPLAEKNKEEQDEFTKEANLETLRKYKREYYNESNATKKKQLAERIRNYRAESNNLFLSLSSLRTQQISEFLWNFNISEHVHSFFDPKLMFSEGNGFDIVIGNPPYGASLKGDYRERVVSALGKVPDFEIYYYFIEKSKSLLKDKGSLVYIIPNTWLFNTFAKEYRTSLFDYWNIAELLDCSKFKIFDTADVRNSIIHFIKNTIDNQNVGYRSTRTATEFYSLVNEKKKILNKNELLKMNQNRSLAFLLTPEEIALINKIKEKGKALSYYFPKISQGLIAYDKYKGQAEEIINSRAYHYNKYHEGLKKRLRGEDVSRYSVKRNGEEWIDYCKGIANPRKPEFFKGKRLLIREITNPRIYATITDEELYNDPAILIALDNSTYYIEVALGIINSKLASFFHFHHSPKATKGSFPKILIQDLKDFPLAYVNEDISKKIKSNVEKIMELKKKDSINDVKEFEKQIDEMIYQLYGLTDEEIQIVEDSVK